MATTNYPLRVVENILPLSVANKLPEAFREWFFTEEVYDNEQPIATCQLCNQEEIRYHFQIRNKFTEKEMWVGSKCILKFKLAVFEDDIELSAEDAKKKLDKLTQKMQLDFCIKALEKLSLKENNEILKNALEYYKKNKFLTPKFAFVVFWRLKENEIDFHPSFFKINLRKNKYKSDLENMDSQQVHMFWNALTSSQKQLAIKLGHLRPNATTSK